MSTRSTPSSLHAALAGSILAGSILAGSILAGSILAGCSPTTPAATRDATVAILTSTIPADGQCTHIVATRLADFQVVDYRGPLAGATLAALPGANRLTATAYPTPCASEPATAPWLADAVETTFAAGANSVTLTFHHNAGVAVGAVFDDGPSPLAIRPGTTVRTGRNGEDTAGGNFALDGWLVEQVALPPATASSTVLFSTEGKGVPYTARGLAHLSDGTFVLQLGEPTSPLYPFNAAGAALPTWPVSYPAGTTVWDVTDGIEAIDDSHFVRTGWLNTPIGCDADGNHCSYSGLDFLTKSSAADGSVSLVVDHQQLLPELATVALSQEYPVGVAPATGGGVTVTTIANDGSGSHLFVLAADGSVSRGPVTVAGDLEGLINAGDHVVAIDYRGYLSSFNGSDLSRRTTETASYAVGLDLNNDFSMAWRSAGAGGWLAATSDNRIVTFDANLGAARDSGIDLSVFNVANIDYRPDTDEVGVLDRVLRPDAAGVRLPQVTFFSLASAAQTRVVRLAVPLAAPLRATSFAWVPATGQIIANFRRPAAADPTIDATAYVFNGDGTLASSFDLRAAGISAIGSVDYDATRDQLLLRVTDAGGVRRILVTSRAGTPQRSYTTESLPALLDLAPISSGAFAGDLGAIQAQPGLFARIALP